MLRATLHIRVRARREADFEQVWQEVAVHARLAKGNLGQTLLRDADDTAHYVICSDWASEADFRNFERSPEQEELTEPIRALRESAAMSVYEVVTIIGAPDPFPPEQPLPFITRS